MTPRIATHKKLTIWEYLLLGIGAVFAIANLLNAHSLGREPVSSLFSVLWLPAAVTFVVFGGKHRDTAMLILLILALTHLAMSYVGNIWVDKIVNQDLVDLSPGTSIPPIGSRPWFVFDATANTLAVLIAVKLTFSGAKPESEGESV